MRYRLFIPLLALFALPAHAQDFPARPVRIVTTSGAGTVMDIAARFLAEKLTKRFGETFFVENKPSAQGQVAATEVRMSAPDGYTLLFGTGGALTVLPALHTSANYTPHDFTAVSLVVRDTNLMIAATANGPRDFDAVLHANDAAHPLTLAVAGSTARMTTQLLIKELPLTARFVGYKSPYEVALDMRRGIVSLGLVYPSDLASLGSAVHPILCLCTERSPVYPDVPTIGEYGHEDIGIAGSGWAALVAPAGTPREIIARLNAGIRDALAQTDVPAFARSIATVIGPSTPKEASKKFADAYRVWHDKVREYPELRGH